MDDFSILDQIIADCEEEKLNNDDKNEKKNNEKFENKCSHKNIIEEGYKILCEDCGMELNKNFNFDREWRYYGNDDSKRNSDPNRCQMRKCEDKNIYKDVEGMDFSDKIVAVANDLYKIVTKKNIFRGDNRKAIVFACIFNAYKILGKPQSCESLQGVFKLDRKNILNGLKHVSLHAPKEINIQCKYITPVEIIEELMEKFNADKSQKAEVIDIYQKVKNKSPVLNRSKPQSIASGLIYYYINVKNKDIDIKSFSKKVNLSESTVFKISQEVDKILTTPVV